jgi:N-acetyl-gamma-glutamyl-phosphate reductase
LLSKRETRWFPFLPFGEMTMFKIAVIGASGYTGLELLRLLSQHPKVSLISVTSRQYAGQSVQEVFPSLKNHVNLVFDSLDPGKVAGDSDLVFTAVPHQASMEIVPKILDRDCRVVDLSADFRLADVSTYEAWYQAHTASGLLKDAVYGLPELFRTQIATSRLVANPGCYPTSIALALCPLLEQKWIDPKSIIIDSKSGTSGAGRSLKQDFLFCEVNEGFKSYGLPKHRHVPEIEQTLSQAANCPVTVTFTPHLLPVNRGILSTCYASKSTSFSLEELYHCYCQRYQNETFVRILPPGQLPNIIHVTGSNYCDIGFSIDDRTNRVVVISVIDNLIKGAAGQAIQNMNLLFKLPENMGLQAAAMAP